MAFQVFNVLQYKDGRPAGGDNSDHIKEQRALGFTRETVGPAQRIFLRYPGERKRLARKARQQNIVGRNGFANMLRGLFIADIRAMAEGNITNVFVEAVLIRVTIPVAL